MTWLMILGAGASLAAPTRIPAFEAMRDAILQELGWDREASSPTYERRTPVAGHTFPPLRSARLSTRAAPPEVVFGTLHRFGIPFAAQVEGALGRWEPRYNAVHAAASEALRRGWPVWTPNIDLAVEWAHQDLAGRLPKRLIVGERDSNGQRLSLDVGTVDASTLVKFHGSADAPGSLAFTELELLAPHTEQEAQHLIALSRGRRVVIYGYAGADTDLHDLIAAAIRVADEVRWYEPSVAARHRIAQTFRGLPITFDPESLPDDVGDVAACVAATATAFLRAADELDLIRSEQAALRDELPRARPPQAMRFAFDPPAIVLARIVERFGRTADEEDALAAARRADLVPRAVRAHLHWAASRSLYRDRGLLRLIVGTAARHPRWIRLMPRRVATYIYNKGPAVLLPAGEYNAMRSLVTRAVEDRGRCDPLQTGSDLYYLAHSLRNLNQPARASETLDAAARQLLDRHGRSDAERYAGVLLERGIIAIHQGRIAAAAAAANELVNGPGRYAIGRWSGWGHWLRAMAHLYAVAVPEEATDVGDAIDAAEDAANSSAEDFSDSALDRARGDVYIVRLLGYRLSIAAGRNQQPPQEPPTLSRRQAHDVALLRAELALAYGDMATADRHLALVERSPSNEVAAAWARLGRAEWARRNRVPGPSLLAIEQEAKSVGAWWLAAQARLGRTGEDQVAIPASPTALRAQAIGEPRVLWLFT